jgi:hypothetical protein
LHRRDCGLPSGWLDVKTPNPQLDQEFEDIDRLVHELRHRLIQASNALSSPAPFEAAANPPRRGSLAEVVGRALGRRS